MTAVIENLWPKALTLNASSKLIIIHQFLVLLRLSVFCPIFSVLENLRTGYAVVGGRTKRIQTVPVFATFHVNFHVLRSRERDVANITPMSLRTTRCFKSSTFHRRHVSWITVDCWLSRLHCGFINFLDNNWWDMTCGAVEWRDWTYTYVSRSTAHFHRRWDRQAKGLSNEFWNFLEHNLWLKNMGFCCFGDSDDTARRTWFPFD